RLPEVLGPPASDAAEQTAGGPEEEPAAFHGRDPEVLEALPREGRPRRRRQGVAVDEGEILKRDAAPTSEEPVRRAPQARPERPAERERQPPHEPADHPDQRHHRPLAATAPRR